MIRAKKRAKIGVYQVVRTKKKKHLKKWQKWWSNGAYQVKTADLYRKKGKIGPPKVCRRGNESQPKQLTKVVWVCTTLESEIPYIMGPI